MPILTDVAPCGANAGRFARPASLIFDKSKRDTWATAHGVKPARGHACLLRLSGQRCGGNCSTWGLLGAEMWLLRRSRDRN